MSYKIWSPNLIYSKYQHVLSHQSYLNDLCNIINNFSQEYNGCWHKQKFWNKKPIEIYKTNSENNNCDFAFIMSAKLVKIILLKSISKFE